MTIDRRDFLALGAAAALPGFAVAQGMDTARILCGFPAGGTTDAVSRRIADKLRPGYAKTVLVENKVGAGGRIAVEELKRSAPDGTTMLMTPAAMITLYPHVYTKLPYGINDVTPVCTACTISFALGVGPAVPETVKNVKDYLAWAKANPDKANYGSPGAGSPPHLLGMLLSKESGVELRHVPYKGSAPGIQDLLGGQVASFSSPIGDYLPHLKGGKLRVLATSGPKRSRFTPDVATYTEQGFGALEMLEWYGFFMPREGVGRGREPRRERDPRGGGDARGRRSVRAARLRAVREHAGRAGEGGEGRERGLGADRQARRLHAGVLEAPSVTA